MRHLSHSWINWQTLGIEKANAALCDSETGVKIEFDVVPMAAFLL